MWIVTGKEICMVKGDYGVQLPIKINGVTFGPNDEVLFTIKKDPNCNCGPIGNPNPNFSRQVILQKTFANVEHNTINLELTEEESTELRVGKYAYSIDWYQAGIFMCNIIPSASFKVVEKA